MSIKQDCFAWHEGGCTALTACLCVKQKNCPFYKTKTQVEAERKKCEARLKKIFGVANTEDMPASVSASLASMGERPKPAYNYKRDRANYQSERIAKLRAEGKCSVCGNDNDRPGMFRCSACAERQKALRIAKETILGE